MRSINPLRQIITAAPIIKNVVKQHDASVVSIDFFDTLVFRTLLAPNDVFKLQALEIAAVFNNISASAWLKIRKDIEAELTKKRYPEEVSLEEIYEKIAQKYNLSDQTTKEMFNKELQLESSVIQPYTDLIAVLRQLYNEGRQIVILTDTYLPESFIQKKINDFIDFDVHLLCSSTTKKTKRSGQAFDHLTELYPNHKIVHFGDNQHSDLAMTYFKSITAYQVRWPRQKAINNNRELQKYLRQTGFTKIKTPYDGMTSHGESYSVKDIACFWAPVLSDFLLKLKSYAQEIHATDIWFFSRDCETMFNVIEKIQLFNDFRIQYVYGSRKCIHPVLIEAGDISRFEDYAGHSVTDEDREIGKTSTLYFQSLIPKYDKARIVMVDIGWKGRLQYALDKIMPDQVDLFGYYFSLEPVAMDEIKKKSRQFVRWNKGIFFHNIVEALSGFQALSVRALKKEGNAFVPVTKPDDKDYSPAKYCEALQEYMTILLDGYVAMNTTTADVTHLEQYKNTYLRKFVFYPVFEHPAVYKTWVVKNRSGRSNEITFLNEKKWEYIASFFKRRGENVDYWQSASVSTITTNPIVGRILQTVILYKMKLISFIEYYLR